MNRLRIIYRRMAYKCPQIRRILSELRFIDKFKIHQHQRKMKKFTVFDYIELAQPAPLITGQCFAQNTFYGNHVAINNFLGKRESDNIPGIIEHGLYLGEYFLEEDDLINSYRRYYTFGDYRKQILISNGIQEKNIISVGPYILHVPSDEKEIARIRNEFGKILLYFPSHSTENVDIVNNRNDILEHIGQIKLDNRFDSVFVCMYYKDILSRKYKQYLELGWKVVTAGHMLDKKFLSRLKILIESSSMTVSDKVGTHLGYCLALNKPHYLIPATYCVVYKNFEEKKVKKFVARDESSKKEEELFHHLFGTYSETITPEQFEIVHKYWGPF